jgi:hypothetical protein
LVFQASLWKISSILQGSITVTFNLFEMIGDTTLVNRKTWQFFRHLLNLQD